MSPTSAFYAIIPRLTRCVRVPIFNTFSSACPAVYFSSKYEKEYKQYLEGQSEAVAKKTKKPAIPKITLITCDNNISISTLPEAQKLSKRRELKLVKVIDFDTKTQRPVYKLMTGAEYHAEDLKQREVKKTERLTDNSLKGEKVLIVSDNISEHDILIHANKIRKWIQKRFGVRVVINGNSSNMEKADKVYSTLESSLQPDIRILQKRTKGSDIKFEAIPPKKDKDENKEQADGVS